MCIAWKSECVHIFTGVPWHSFEDKGRIPSVVPLLPLWDVGLPVEYSCVHHAFFLRALEILQTSCSMPPLVLCDYRPICCHTWFYMGLWTWTQSLQPEWQALYTRSHFPSPILNVLRVWNTLTLPHSLKAWTWTSLKLQQESVILGYYLWHSKFELLLSYVLVGTLNLLINFISSLLENELEKGFIKSNIIVFI